MALFGILGILGSLAVGGLFGFILSLVFNRVIKKIDPKNLTKLSIAISAFGFFLLGNSTVVPELDLLDRRVHLKNQLIEKGLGPWIQTLETLDPQGLQNYFDWIATAKDPKPRGSNVIAGYFLRTPDQNLIQYLDIYVAQLKTLTPLEICQWEKPGLYGPPPKPQVEKFYMGLMPTWQGVIRGALENSPRVLGDELKTQWQSFYKQFTQDNPGMAARLEAPKAYQDPVNLKALSQDLIKLYENLLALPTLQGANFYRIIKTQF